ncbi:DMT family transporter [Aliiruegeria haliotis]|nr:DMT family transporter [Aliiruegeria haliotis]
MSNWLLITFLGVIWGAAFMTQAIALEGFAPLTLAALRTSIAAVFLWGVGAMAGQPLSSITRQAGARGWRFSFVIGLASFAVPFVLLAWGLQFVPSAFAGITMGMLPLLILPLVAVFSPEEGIGPRRIVGVTLGFIGLIILIGPEAILARAGDNGLWGRLACIGAACCYAIGSVATRLAPKMPPIAFAAATLGAAGCLLMPLALAVEGIPNDLSLRPVLALLYVALLPTAIAGVIRIRVITTAGSLFMSITNYMVPVWAVIFGVTLMREDLPAQMYVALALILLGIAVSQSRAIQASVRARRR